MGKRFNMQDARSAVAFHAGMGVGLDAVNLEYRTKIPSIIKKVIQKEEALESLGEELRVLYVALTRAKEKLIITGTLSNPEDKISDGRVFQGNKRKIIILAAEPCGDVLGLHITGSSAYRRRTIKTSDLTCRRCGKRKHRRGRKKRDFQSCS